MQNFDQSDLLTATPICFILLKRDRTIVAVLIAAGADINILAYNNSSLLHYAVQNNDTEIVQQLVAANANTTLRDEKDKLAIDLTTNQEIIDIINRTKTCRTV